MGHLFKDGVWRTIFDGHDNIIGKIRVKEGEPGPCLFDQHSPYTFHFYFGGGREPVSELDEQWAAAVAEAERRARAAGRTDMADYLTLRAANDLARSTGIEWLFETFQTLAGRANRAGSSIQTTHRDAHRFHVGNATMVGRLVTFSLGVRRLLVEAGWPRVPRDGFVRGGGLASAHVRHFGQRSADEELLLVRAPEGAPQWLVLEKTGERTPLSEARVSRHLSRFLSEK